MKQLIPMYVNVTGPGDYTIPGFTNKLAQESDSRKWTAPSFTCAPRTKQPWLPEYEVVSIVIVLLSSVLMLSINFAGFQRARFPRDEPIPPQVQTDH